VLGQSLGRLGAFINVRLVERHSVV
jgi:prolipoprotein diacylglyceryltransferase